MYLPSVTPTTGVVCTVMSLPRLLHPLPKGSSQSYVAVVTVTHPVSPTVSFCVSHCVSHCVSLCLPLCL